MPFDFRGPNTTLNGAIAIDATTLVVTSAASFPATPFLAYIVAEGSNTAEWVSVLSRVTTTCTIARAANQDGFGGPASAHGSGAVFMVATRSGPANPWPDPTALRRLNDGGYDFSSLPTSDPHVVGEAWNSSGNMKVSAG